MNTNRTIRLVIPFTLMISPLLLAVLACGGSGGGSEPAPEGGAAATIAAGSAQLTLQAGSAQLTQLASEPGTGPQATEPPPGAPPSSLPTITAIESTNCREGPLPEYTKVGALLKGQSSTVHGVNANKDWWYIENPNAEGQYCWVWGETTQVSGDVAALQIVESSPLPTVETVGESPEEPPAEPPPEPPPEPGDSGTAFELDYFEDPSVFWDTRMGPSGMEYYLAVRQSAHITPAEAGVELVVSMLIIDTQGNVADSYIMRATTDSSGQARFWYTGAEKKEDLSYTPASLEISWQFSDWTLGQIPELERWSSADVPPPQ